jgi:hypothetical protein
MIDAPRGRYIGKLVGARPKDEAEHFIKCRPAAAGLIAVIWARSLSTKGRCRIRRRIGAMTTKKPRYESRVFDGVP